MAKPTGVPAVSPRLVVSVFLFLLPPVSVLSPTAVTPLFVATAFLLGLRQWALEHRIPLRDQALVVMIAGFVLWSGVTSFWSYDVVGGVTRALRLAFIALAGLVLLSSVTELDASDRRTAATMLLCGFAAGLLILGVERLFDQPIRYLLVGQEESINPLTRLNRGVIAHAILVWPVVAVLWRNFGALSLLVPAAVLWGFTYFESGAAIAALAGGGLSVILSFVPRLPLHRMLSAILIVGVLAGPLIAKGLYRMDLHEAEFVPSNFQDRTYIWNFVADRIAERPIFGWGLDSSRDIPNFGVQPFLGGEGSVIGLHPHNAVLQIWLELGAVGAALVLVTLLLAVGLLLRLPRPDRALALGLFISLLVVACFSFGLWQTKWLSTIFASAAAMIICIPVREDQSPKVSPR